MSRTRLLAKAIDGSPAGADITWAGSNPFERGLGFGLDNGSIVFASDKTGLWTSYPQICPSGEAINGFAAIGTHSLAVSTRADVSFIQLDLPKDRRRAVFPGGAHGVIATKSGYFVAPLGPAGLLVVKPTNADEQPMNVTDKNEGELYFSRVAALSDDKGKEILIFANRRNGFGTSPFNGDKGGRRVHTMRFEGIDVIDVCPVAPTSHCAIAISMRAEVLWVRDASRHDDPLAMRLSGVEGPVYRVLATPRHLFVLSSKALYVWTDLVEHVLFNDKVVPNPSPLVLPVKAVGMSLIRDEYLLLVMGTNAVISILIGDFERESANDTEPHSFAVLSPEMAQQTKLESFSPRWQVSDVEQRLMAAAK
jgi:hypothetical protein